jgi:hypothetical protein
MSIRKRNFVVYTILLLTSTIGPSAWEVMAALGVPSLRGLLDALGLPEFDCKYVRFGAFFTSNSYISMV